MPHLIREFLKTRGGTVVTAVAFLAVMAFAVSSLFDTFGTSRAGALSRDRLFICAETGKAFRHAIEAGEPIPVLSPYSGKHTGFEAELCYWTADGAVKQEPTPVLLNSYLDKEESTFCPDCRRLVTRWNPPPRPGQAPPTRDQVMANGANTATAVIDE